MPAAPSLKPGVGELETSNVPNPSGCRRVAIYSRALLAHLNFEGVERCKKERQPYALSLPDVQADAGASLMSGEYTSKGFGSITRPLADSR